mgnify:CR=1 FL=1
MRDNEFKARLRSHSRNMKNSIDSPFDITQKIDEMETKNMTKKNVSFNWIKKTVYSAAAIAAAFVMVVNCIPGLAYAASDVPILGDIVRVVTFGRLTLSSDVQYRKASAFTRVGADPETLVIADDVNAPCSIFVAELITIAPLKL